MNDKLPVAWAFGAIQILGEVLTGSTPSKKKPEFYGGSFPIFKPTDLDAGNSVSAASEFLSESGKALSRFIPAHSTLVTCIGATIGKTGFSLVDGTCNQQINAIIPSAALDPKWLYHWMCSPQMQTKVIDGSSSTTMPIINKSKFAALEITVPPLAEQQEIAARLDTLLAQVDTLKGRLDALPAILKRFRQSVLSAAVSGKLTDNESKLRQAPFNDLIKEMKNGLSPKPNEDGLGHPILRISSVRPQNVDQTDIRHLECDEKVRSIYSLQTDDLLFTRYNGSLDFVGVCGRYQKKDHDTLLYPDKLIRVRTKLDLLLPKYAEIFFSAPQTRKVVTDFIKSTSGQKGISGKDLKSVLVDYPPLEEQTEIVRRAEQLFDFADQVEQRVKDAQTRVNHLTQSILAKAFRGELTADWRQQHPDLISGENSAEGLLARIQAERAAKAPVKRTRKKKAEA